MDRIQRIDQLIEVLQDLKYKKENELDIFDRIAENIVNNWTKQVEATNGKYIYFDIFG